MLKRLFALFVFSILFFSVVTADAAYQARFDAINFDPAVDASNYYTVYGSRSLKGWQGHAGLYFDYANRPLEFRATTGATGRQSVLDHTIIMNAYGTMGFTDWFEVGLNIPIVLYNWYYTDNPASLADFGGSMGDVLAMVKFRVVDIDEHSIGFSILPYITLPSGDITRYSGSGHVTGGVKLIVDGKFHERFEMSLNAGYLMRDDTTRTFAFSNGSTTTIRIDDIFTAGIGANFKVSRNFQIIAESYMASQILRNFFDTTNTTSLEAGGGIRYYFGDSGFALNAGGAAGLMKGVGTPRFRGFLGVSYTSPETQPCPPCAPDPRIKDNKIVLWGKIFFDTAKATIKKISYPVLDDVVDVLRSHPEIRLVEIQGHTDWRGSDAYNKGLSQRRAESSRQYLITAGIAASRLRAVGYGESRPIASNSTVEGMSQNRRSEFVILQSNAGYTTKPSQAEVTEMQYQPIPDVNVKTDTVVAPTPAPVPAPTPAVETTPAPKGDPDIVIPDYMTPMPTSTQTQSQNEIQGAKPTTVSQYNRIPQETIVDNNQK